MRKILQRLYSIVGLIGKKGNKNVFWLLCLNMVIAVSQFTVYATINRVLGKETLGVWSLVTAASAIGQISSFGFSSGLVRYIPELLYKKQYQQIRNMLGTVTLLNFVLSLPLLVILYFPSLIYAQHLLVPEQFETFKSVIIWAMAGLFINNLFGVYSSLIDGFQKYYLRCLVQISGWIIFLLLSLILVPQIGLKGVSISFFIQSVWQLLFAAVLVSQKDMLHRGVAVSFDKKSFRLVSSFGIKSQTVSLLVIFFDPLVKFFITKYLGIAATGNYEIANKIATQVRNLLVSANQVIIPKLVWHKSAGGENAYFNSINKRNIFLSAGAGLVVLLISPLAVLFFSNGLDIMLLNAIVIINAGWVCNMITSLHYYACTSFDKLNSVIVYHLLLALFAASAYLLISHFGKTGLIYYSVPAVALFIGSLYNSYAVSGIIHSAFSWLLSPLFIYFIAASGFLLILAPQTLLSLYMILAIIFAGFMIISWRIYKPLNFFQKNNSNEKRGSAPLA